MYLTQSDACLRQKTAPTDDVPPLEDLIKIEPALQAIGTQYHANVYNLVWWDIAAPDRFLFATVERDQRSILVAFLWKKTAKGSHPAPAYPHLGWNRDLSASEGWRFEFEATTYQQVKASFEKWLTEPIPPHP